LNLFFHETHYFLRPAKRIWPEKGMRTASLCPSKEG
jgi:hypothetical protein